MKKDPMQELLELEYMSGGTSIRKLARKYGMSTTTVHRRLMSVKKSKRKKRLPAAAKPGKGMPDDVKQLQEELYNAQLKISLLEAMIDISDERFGTDIRKKAGTRQS